MQVDYSVFPKSFPKLFLPFIIKPLPLPPPLPHLIPLPFQSRQVDKNAEVCGSPSEEMCQQGSG